MSIKNTGDILMKFTDTQLERYSRNILLGEVGPGGQKKLLASRVLIVGAGGLGSPAALYLAAAGVGTIGIADGDTVDLSNLQRQILHGTADVGIQKTESAARRVAQLNPDVSVIPHPYRLTAENIRDIIREYDFIIDGTDSFPSKYLVNDACVLEEKPYSHGGILRFHGQSITRIPGHTCLRCIMPKAPADGSSPRCSEAGVLGVVAGVLGAVQGGEAIKYILGLPGLLTDRLFHFDLLTMHFGTVAVKRNSNCPLCGDGAQNIELLPEEDNSCEQ
jgi:molybdopterin-synthase adenylyltransferase